MSHVHMVALREIKELFADVHDFDFKLRSSFEFVEEQQDRVDELNKVLEQFFGKKK